MTICREWTLVKWTQESRHAKPLKCRSWGCEYCRPDRKKQLMAMAAAGNATRFLTLTVNPKIGDSPAHRLRLLSNAWRTYVKRLRRLHGKGSIEYLAVVEETKNGEPHLHILLRSPYIAQSSISSAMAELIDSPIVDIRKIKNQRHVVAYIAKYITKAPAQFDGSKRYWQTPGFQQPADTDDMPVEVTLAPWTVARYHIGVITSVWASEGWTVLPDGPERFIALTERRERQET